MKRMKTWLALLMSAAMIGGGTSCGLMENIDPNQEPESKTLEEMPGQTTAPTETTVTTTTTTEEVIVNPTVHMIAVGDNLVQTYVYRAAQNWAGGTGYDFTKSYENIAPLVAAADVAAINQETLICGGDYEISGSNFNFNSPVELGDELVEIGFDVFTLANNHVLDKGINGLASSLDYWDSMMSKHPILATGAYRDTTDQNQIRIQEVNGMKIAYLCYAEHLNGYSIPADSPMKVSMTSDEALIERQIREANEMADAVIVQAHWGWEDSHDVAPAVKDLANKMVQWGADVVLGGHSHTAETMEYITRVDGSRGFVFYSLGNFISAQTDNFNVVGEMGDFNLTLDMTTGELIVSDVKCIPIITHYDNGQFGNLRLYPYYMYTAELANSHGLPYAPMGTAKAFNMDVINNIINANIPAEFQQLSEPEWLANGASTAEMTFSKETPSVSVSPVQTDFAAETTAVTTETALTVMALTSTTSTVTIASTT